MACVFIVIVDQFFFLFKGKGISSLGCGNSISNFRPMKALAEERLKQALKPQHTPPVFTITVLLESHIVFLICSSRLA